jgi:Tol biopolymer transport system component/tRNA A-37 threonylcarbamoyl transferase component Bud32
VPILLDRLKAALADRYAIEEELGSGGMATVYLAEDLKHKRKVAVKVLRPELAATLGPERFLREIEVAAQLTHPHILPLHDSGDADGFLYYVMPYIEGQSLREKLATEGELPIAEAVKILREVVDALASAHKHGVVHRDIKPDNVLLSETHAMVTDFGVAKAVHEATGRETLTTAGVALGTPSYMAPEQAAADPHIDQRADIYAIGVLAYELLAGRPPFTGATSQMVLAAHMTQTPEPVTAHRAAVPPALAALVMKCLEKKPADRWQSAEELLPQLEVLATPSGGVTPTATMPVSAVAARRRYFTLALGTISALIVIVVFGTQMLKGGPLTITTSNIRAVTNEPGMEVHPALSPDGSLVAYEKRGADGTQVAIRSTVNIGGGGESTPALEGPETQVAPAWSPDGEFVRFWGCDPGSPCSWREVGKLGGSISTVDVPANVRGTALARCSWSPDGSRVVFPAADSIFAHSTNDGITTLIALTEVPWAAHSFAWSPDGARIAYVNGSMKNVDGTRDLPSSIWIVGAGRSEPVRVTGNEYMNESPTWLDNRHLLFVSTRDGQREVYVIPVGPTGPRGQPLKVPGPIGPHSISYSVPDKKLAYAKLTGRQNIWSYPLGRSEAVSIRDGVRVTEGNQVIWNHDVSPDGAWIVYDSDLRGNMDIYKRHVEGGNPIPLSDAPTDEFWPRWSPRGNEIAFYTWESYEERVGKVVPADGGTAVELRDLPREAMWPSWSPNGLEIALRSTQTGRPEVWLLSRDSIGGVWHGARQLTDFGCEGTDWAPDGAGVLCVALEELVLVSRNGEPLWRRDPSPAILLRDGVPKFSPDGSRIYFWGVDEDDRMGIWAIPTEQGEPRLIVAYDDPVLDGLSRFSVGAHQLYLTVGEYESDIWVLDVEW